MHQRRDGRPGEIWQHKDKERVVTGGGERAGVDTDDRQLLDKELIITPAADACTGAALMGAAGTALTNTS